MTGIGEVRIEPNNTVEWRIAGYSSLQDGGNAHLSRQLLCHGIKWRFGLIYNEGWNACITILPSDRRRNLGLLTEDFVVTITNGYRKPSESKWRVELQYQPEEGWYWIIDKFILLKIANGGDLIISWSLMQDIDSTGINAWSDLKQLYLRQDCKNLTLFLKDQEFRAHKEILKARSSLFKCLLSPPELHEKADSVDLDDYVDNCDPDTFEDFLMYLYSPSVETITASNALGLYKTANIFDVKDLTRECVKVMMKELSVDNFFDFAGIAFDWRECLLLEACLAFYKKNAVAISKADKWHSLQREKPNLFHRFFIRME